MGITRRTFVWALAAAGPAVAADPAREVWDVLAGMASALAVSDATTFLFAFDPAIPGFDSFRAEVTGLLNEVTVDSSISPIANTGNAQNRILEVDWSMRLVDLNDVAEVTPREAHLKLGMERRRGHWKVISFQPADFFRPPARAAVATPPRP